MSYWLRPSSEYESHRTLPAFAKKYLEKDFRCTFLKCDRAGTE